MKDKWHGLENLKLVLDYVKQDAAYKTQFTSVDRISELQELFFIIKNNLIHSAFADGEEMKSIKDELNLFRGYLNDIVLEWEACAAEIDMVSKKLVSNTKREYYSRVVQESDTSNIGKNEDPRGIDLLWIGAKLKIGEPVDSNCPKLQHVNGEDTPVVNLNKFQKAEFESMLSYLKSCQNIKISDEREKQDGRLYISILKPLRLNETKILKKLIEFGIEIWSGKEFLSESVE